MTNPQGQKPKFQKLDFTFDPGPILAEVEAKPQLWDQNWHRTKSPNSPHKEASDIWLLFNALARPEVMRDSLEAVPYPAWLALAEAQKTVLRLLHFAKGLRLGRTVISRLPPGGKIALHRDEDANVAYYTRYQLALAGTANFIIDGKAQVFLPGEVWIVDVARPHCVLNGADGPRLALVCDIHTYP